MFNVSMAKNSSKDANSGKDFITAYVLSIFFGWLGVDRFYLGHIVTGIIKLLTLGGYGIWTLIDIVLILTGKLKSANGQELKNRKKNLKGAIILTGAVVGFAVIILIPVMLIGALASDPVVENKPAIVNNPKPKVETSKEVPEQLKPQPKKEAKFEGVITYYAPINPATLQFTASIKNNGNAPGKFSCTVRGKDASSTYRGYDIFSDDSELQPGSEKNFNGVITITNEGAYYVTDVSVSC